MQLLCAATFNIFLGISWTCYPLNFLLWTSKWPKSQPILWILTDNAYDRECLLFRMKTHWEKWDLYFGVKVESDSVGRRRSSFMAHPILSFYDAALFFKKKGRASFSPNTYIPCNLHFWRIKHTQMYCQEFSDWFLFKEICRRCKWFLWTLPFLQCASKDYFVEKAEDFSPLKSLVFEKLAPARHHPHPTNQDDLKNRYLFLLLFVAVPVVPNVSLA